VFTHSNSGGSRLAEGRGEAALYPASSSTARRQVSEALRTKTEPRLAQCIQPLEDPRWDLFVQAHPPVRRFFILRHGCGHSPNLWIRTGCVHDHARRPGLAECHGVLPRGESVDRTPPGFVPFSDHCEPLLDTEDDLEALTAAMSRMPPRAMALRGTASAGAAGDRDRTSSHGGALHVSSTGSGS